MNLKTLLSNHKSGYREKLVKLLAVKNSLTTAEVESSFMDFIEQHLAEKYTPASLLIEKINNIQTPVLLNIRRGREEGEEFCKICHANQPNVDKVARKYGDRIEVVEASIDKPDGSALYHIIYYEDAENKMVPMTAVINKGEVLKFWTGVEVKPDEYGEYFDKLVE
jgi:hypothetical protein